MSRIRLISVVVLAAVILAGCQTRKPILSAADVPEGASLVITSTYTRTWANKTFLRSEAGWIYRRVFDLSFIQFEPKFSAFWRFQGGRDDIKAYVIRPGRYTFWAVDSGSGIAWFDRHDHQYTFTVGEGEAVYIGDVAITKTPGKKATLHTGTTITTKPGTFKVETVDNRERAQAFFDKNFVGSNLTFKVNLAKHEWFDIPKITAFRKRVGR